MAEPGEMTPELRANLGTRRVPPLPAARFPDAGAAVATLGSAARRECAVDVLLVNPPAPDGAIWIRSQHRVGRRSRENMIWPQVDLAQMAAMLPEYRVEIVDCVATRMGWPEFERLLAERRPRFYVTQVTAPTLQNDMYGAFLARSLGAVTVAFGTHVTPLTLETMRPYPALDLVLRGEPELTLQELVRAVASGSKLAEVAPQIAGLAWRNNGTIVINPDRPFIPSLDDLPMPRHDLLPLARQRMPMIRGPFTFIVTSRGCPAGCKYCIKHVSYQTSVRLRSPALIVEELKLLAGLGIHHVHMYADLFTVNRQQAVEMCRLISDAGLKVEWTCNSRVDYVDEEMLRLMARAGCRWISWGIESANEAILKAAAKGYKKERAIQALRWSKSAGIKNWGFFIIGLPGETEETIRETIDYAKNLPLDIALFHIAAPYPGTPFFFEVAENGWFRPGTRWEEVDMDRSTVLDYPGLPAERLEYWQKRATREWSMRPGPILTFLKGMNSWDGFKSAVSVGLQMVNFVRS